MYENMADWHIYDAMHELIPAVLDISCDKALLKWSDKAFQRDHFTTGDPEISMSILERSPSISLHAHSAQQQA